MKIKHFIFFYLVAVVVCFVLAYFDLSRPAITPLYAFVVLLGMGSMQNQLKVELIDRLEKIGEGQLVNSFRGVFGKGFQVFVFFNKALSEIQDREVKNIVFTLKGSTFIVLIAFLTIIPLIFWVIHLS